MKKQMIILLAALILMLNPGSYVQGIAVHNDNCNCIHQSSSVEETDSEAMVGEDGPEDNVDDEEEDEDDRSEENQPQPNAEVKPQVISTTGSYVGQIDSNSIEVKVDGKPIALFFSERVKQTFNPRLFKKNAKIKVEYFRNAQGQNILTKIEPVI
jgi:hypothetical protein